MKKVTRPRFATTEMLKSLDFQFEYGFPAKNRLRIFSEEWLNLTTDQCRAVVHYYESVMHDRPAIKRVNEIDRLFGS